MKIEIDDAGTVSILEKIRKKVGGHLRNDFVPVRASYRMIEVVIEEVVGPHGMLVHKDQPVLIYIKDHIATPKKLLDDPCYRNKVHFSFCRQLNTMKRRGRLHSRYQIANRTDNLYLITVKKVGVESEEKIERLYPCRYCLGKFGYKGYKQDLQKSDRDRIVEEFDRNEAMPWLQQRYDRILGREATNLRKDTAPAGYPDDHIATSRDYRASKCYVCEICGKQCDRGNTHMHHIDGNKSNDAPDNLQCLCKPCHRKIHPHMR